MEQYTGATESHSPNQDLVRVADELLEHTRALRRQHEELRDALAGIGAAPRAEVPVREEAPERAPDADNGGPPNALHPMVLQMALGGETREAAKEQLHALGAEHGDSLVDEVYDRVESERATNGRRRLFSRG